MVLFLAPALPRAIEALLLIDDVAAGPGPSRFKASRPPPDRETIDYRSFSSRRRADVYRPGGGEEAEAALVVIPGIVRLGKDDPRIIAFAESMARARFDVFVPDLQSLRNLSIRSEDAEEIGALILHIANDAFAETGATIGIVAFSYAAGPAILAAMRPETQTLVRFVYAIGPYYDMEAVGTFLTTGYIRESSDREWQKRTPSPYATWVFVNSSAGLLESANDREILRQMSEIKLADPEADIADLAARLGREGQAVYRLLLNTDPERVPPLISELPPPLLAELRRLNLRSKNMADLKANLILLHGRDDALLPYSESIALAAAAGSDKAHLFVIDSLIHVELRAGGIVDLWKLWRASCLLLRERDAMQRPKA
jgi:hypothetical protein